ncbi:DHH family phosphoesterase [Crassaminicella indica]|uniref:Bifunctional oligoribonuclease/PAP phosphatase NrnA n=1 Tax=Crassaminicella indica TaxID=2855394 RepID=A0ABX8RAM8_9CLOT|nr:bifunctional oligoribonuclease/PAP phosphatase NrnA [Crassaminicella indica]QXM06102.1 bifunctional oligoribonuclease/PAP phosphatase NrnA [Crassaminicella indica]
MKKKIINMKEALDIIHKADNILILPHILPDGDTIGSSVALYLALKKIGKHPVILLDEELPYNIKFLSQKYIRNKIDESFMFDLAISIDCSDVDRLGDRKEYIHKAKNSLNIDHHVTNTYFADINVVDSKAAATGEIIYFIIKAMKVAITKDIATCIYTALSTDTGSFKYDNTSSQTHRIVAELIEKNIDLNFITTQIYQNKPLYKVKLLSEVLNTLELYFDNKLAILCITKEMLERIGAKKEDTDGIIEFARDINGVEVGVLLKEMEKGKIKVGFRAKYDVDVSKIAESFNGGGHKKASGCSIYDNMNNAKALIIKEIENYL